MKALVTRLTCWWFGCVPDYDAQYYDPEDGWSEPPCRRCDALAVDYADCVGDTRHRRFVEFCRRWLMFGWIPRRCRDCGERPDKCDCPPF